MNLFNELLYLLSFISDVFPTKTQEENTLKVNKAIEQKMKGSRQHEQEQ